MAEIEAAPEADVVQFVVKATPLSEEAKERSIAGELQLANDNLTRANATIERHKAEGRALRALVEQSRIRIEELERAFSDVSNAAVVGLFNKPANPLEEGSSEVRESISHDDLAKLQAELERRAALISDLESAVAATKQQYGGDEKVERRVSELEELLNQARTHNVTAAFLMQAEVRTVRVQLAEAELKANDAHAAAQASVVQREQAARELRVEREAERSAVAAREALDNDRVARITELENMLSEFAGQ